MSETGRKDCRVPLNLNAALVLLSKLSLATTNIVSGLTMLQESVQKANYTSTSPSRTFISRPSEPIYTAANDAPASPLSTLASLPPELILMIASNLDPSQQLRFALTSKLLWWKLRNTIIKHRPLAEECARQLLSKVTVSEVLDWIQAQWYLLPYVKRLRLQQCICSARFGRALHDVYCINQVLHRSHQQDIDLTILSSADTEYCNILAILLMEFSGLSRLAFQIPSDSLETQNTFCLLASNPLQHLTHVAFWDEKQNFSLPLNWLRIVLSFPSIHIIHGSHLNSSIPPTQEMANLTRPISISSAKGLILTSSILLDWYFDISHVPLDTCLINLINCEGKPLSNPSRVTQKLPKTLKHLAVLQGHIHYRKQVVFAKAISLVQFQKLETLWCFWSLIVPDNSNLRNFDISSVLPKSLTWLVLFAVPNNEVVILLKALSRMPQLRKIWVHVRGASRACRDLEPDDILHCRYTRNIRSMIGPDLSWVGPESSSVFSQYTQNLIVDYWPGKERGGQWRERLGLEPVLSPWPLHERRYL